jgi:hypothetical protein
MLPSELRMSASRTFRFIILVLMRPHNRGRRGAAGVGELKRDAKFGSSAMAKEINRLVTIKPDSGALNWGYE